MCGLSVDCSTDCTAAHLTLSSLAHSPAHCLIRRTAGLHGAQSSALSSNHSIPLPLSELLLPPHVTPPCSQHSRLTIHTAVPHLLHTSTLNVTRDNEWSVLGLNCRLAMIPLQTAHLSV